MDMSALCLHVLGSRHHQGHQGHLTRGGMGYLYLSCYGSVTVVCKKITRLKTNENPVLKGFCGSTYDQIQNFYVFIAIKPLL